MLDYEEALKRISQIQFDCFVVAATVRILDAIKWLKGIAFGDKPDVN